MSDVLAVIVTHNPDQRAVELGAALIGQGCAVLVVDNDSPDGRDSLSRLARLGATVLDKPVNEGVAGALADALEYAAAGQRKWLLTFDQDSVIDPGFVSSLLGSVEISRSSTAIVAARILDQRTGAVIQGAPDAESGEEVERVITSGSLCRVAALVAVGGFRRKLFIDFVDWELCARLRCAGWRIWVEPMAILRHSIGRAEQRRLLCWTVTVTNHSPDRLYYRYRNFVLLWREGVFRSTPGWLSRTVVALMLTPFKIVMYERGRRGKCSAILRGVLAGVFAHTSRASA